jgi:two-component system, sensor histidine kinase and response regulator
VGQASSPVSTSMVGQASLPESVGRVGQASSPVSTSMVGQASLPESVGRVGQASSPVSTSMVGQASLPALPGLNIDGALARLGVGFDALKRMLLRYADGQPKTLGDLRAALAAGDAPGTARHAHALAGAAGNLGADTLREAAKALEHAAREGRGGLDGLAARVEDLAATVSSSIDALRAPVETALPAPPADEPAAGVIDAAALDEAVRTLRDALETGDPDATSAAFDVLSALSLPAAAHDAVRRARALADDYQFDDAAGAVAPLLPKRAR